MHAWKVCWGQLLCKAQKSRLRALGHRVCLKIMLSTITMQGLTLTATIASEKLTFFKTKVKPWQSHSSTKSSSRAPGHSTWLKSMSFYSYYTRYDTHSYLRFRETHFNARLTVKSWQSCLSVQSRSRALSHSVCLKSMSRTITIQGLTQAAISASEKPILMLDST